MRPVASLITLLVFCRLVAAQEAEIVEAQHRLAIINAGSRQGLHRSDTLWVSGFIDKGDHLIAKAKVIALRRRHSAIEAFQFFGAYGLAVGQVVHRVRNLPAPFTAPPKRSSQTSQRPELTLADVYRQRPRVFLFAGAARADDFATSFSGGAGARLPVFPGLQITLSGRYIALSSSTATRGNVDDAAQRHATSMWVVTTGFRPLSRLVILEIGGGLYQTHGQSDTAEAAPDWTFNDFGVAASIGTYLKLRDRSAWMTLVSYHRYFPDQGARQFFTLELQFAF